MYNFNIPVLITIWDRPEYVKQLLEVLSIIKPVKLFIFSDITNEIESIRYKKILESRSLINKYVNWDATIYYRYNSYNEGPALGLYNAISWAFEKVDKLIILEHDYIPSISFFPYCEELLNKYQEDERIWIISGLNHFEGKYNLNNNDSYFFSKYASIAGFATWKRCWNDVDIFLKKWPLFLKNNYRFDHLNKKEWKTAYLKYNKFYKNRILQNNINTWDMQFVFNIWSHGGTGIVPSKNLIKMIGIDGYNTKNPSPFHFLKTYDDYKITKHPDFIQNNWLYDYNYYKRGYFYFKKNIFKRILRKIKRILKNI